MLRLTRRLPFPAALATALLAMPLAHAAAQEGPPAGDATTGVVLVAHGAGPDWNGPVIEMANAARLAGPVEVAFLMGSEAPRYRFQDAVARLEARGAERVVVVPLLVSSHSSHYEQIRYLVGQTDTLSEVMLHHLHMAGIERPEGSVPLHLTPALDDAAQVAEVMLARALAQVEDPSTRAVYLVGHGPNGAEDHARWMENLRSIAERVRAEGRFRDVRTGTVRDDAPDAVREEAVRSVREVIELQHGVTGHDVVVVPLLVSRGYLSTQKLPRDLAGLPVVYDAEGLLPHPALARWLEDRVRTAAEGATFASPGPLPSGTGHAPGETHQHPMGHLR